MPSEPAAIPASSEVSERELAASMRSNILAGVFGIFWMAAVYGLPLVIGSVGALAGGWIKDHVPRAWGAALLLGGAPFSYFQILIVLQVLLAWGVVLPLLGGILEPRSRE